MTGQIAPSAKVGGVEVLSFIGTSMGCRDWQRGTACSSTKASVKFCTRKRSNSTQPYGLGTN